MSFLILVVLQNRMSGNILNMIQQRLDFPLSLDEKFKEMDEKNPLIYSLFKFYTFQAIALGEKHYSADRVFHDIRADSPADMQENYKINNNYISRYARKFMEEFPEHAGFFRTRQLKT